MTESSTGAVEVPKAIGEDLRHENQGLQGNNTPGFFYNTILFYILVFFGT